MKLAAWIGTVLMAGSLCAAGENERSFTDAIVDGSLSVSNGSDSVALEIERIAFALPVATVSNAFTITHIRTFRPVETNATVITTNANVIGYNDAAVVSTNTYKIPQAAITFTNTYTLRGSTNTTDAVVYDYRDFGEGFMVAPGDRMTFTITYTNGPVYLTRTVEQHPIP